MERHLFIIRHGKSSWDHPDLQDIDRPLAPRGLMGAETMARRLLKRGTVPSLIYTSPAKRALNTALIMSRIWNLDASRLQIYEEIYDAYLRELEDVVARAPDEEFRLAIYGHNPAFTAYANKFLEAPLDNLPTAGVVHVVLDSDSWKGLKRKHVLDTFVDFPKKKA
jgi:phosphohistidine phosphatase